METLLPPEVPPVTTLCESASNQTKPPGATHGPAALDVLSSEGARQLLERRERLRRSSDIDAIYSLMLAKDTLLTFQAYARKIEDENDALRTTLKDTEDALYRAGMFMGRLLKHVPPAILEHLLERER